MLYGVLLSSGPNHRRRDVPARLVRCGFTLLELLTVVAILAILLSLLLPGLARAKLSALRTSCASNVHQIGTALHLYLDDFEKFPSFDDTPGELTTYALRSRYWDGKLLSYAAGAQRVFLCPLNTSHNTVSNNWFGRDSAGEPWPNRSYGYNGTGTAPDPYPVLTGGPETFLGFGAQGFPANLPEGRVRAPADMIAIADYDPQATDDDNDDDRHPEMLFLGLMGRHASGANVLFCDSHVEYDETNRLTASDVTARQRWNFDHQPHR